MLNVVLKYFVIFNFNYVFFIVLVFFIYEFLICFVYFGIWFGLGVFWLFLGVFLFVFGVIKLVCCVCGFFVVLEDCWVLLGGFGVFSVFCFWGYVFLLYLVVLFFGFLYGLLL